ncbi:DNA adenine methylase [Herbiconiux sp. A18JL235]|uniref:site-specific DNA-methyltransferase (adenine-specific) n=1 Tax=Herbiconiux sp. A18JL235 TaxID=3152363 RepID=A0AB39BBN6_9MICO
MDCLPGRVDGYLEPFLDSGSVALAVLHEHPDAVVTLASPCTDLVLAWEVARDEPEAFIAAVAFHAERHSDPYFRAELEADPSDPVQRAARFAYLRGTADLDEGGRTRSHFAGALPVRGRPALDPTGIRALSRLLRQSDVTFEVRGPFETLRLVREDDLVLLDPPFGRAEASEREVRSWLNAAVARGASVLAPTPGWDGEVSVDPELYRGWAGMVPVNDRAADERLWGGGQLARRLRAERGDRP